MKNKKSNFFENLKHFIKKAPFEHIKKVIISVLLRGVLLVIPLLLSELINNLTKGNYENAIFYFILLTVSAVFYRLCESVNNYFYYKLYKKIYQTIYNNIIGSTFNNSIFSLSRFSTGEYTNLITNDANVVTTFYTNLIARTIQFLEFVFIFSYFFKLNRYLFIFVLVSSLILFLITIKTSKRIQKYSLNVKKSLDDVISSSSEYFSGIKEIKSFNLFKKMTEKLKNNMTLFLDYTRVYNNKSTNHNQGYLLVWELFRMISVLFGIYLLKEGQIEIGVILIIYNYYQKIIDNFGMILTINIDYQNLVVSLDRINKIFEYSKRILQGIDDLENVVGRIKFDKVLYGYRNNPILNNVSFILKENSINVLTSKKNGPKTGVFDLLLRLNAQHEGTITIDDIDINKISENTYFNLLSITREEPFFFDMSIKDNLLLIEEDYEKIIKISKKVGLDDYLKDFPKGYDTKFSDDNNINSVIKQLVSITRLLVKDSKIMLFDESIDMLDKKERKKFMKVLKELSIDRTIVISTYDEDIISFSDNIIELK